MRKSIRTIEAPSIGRRPSSSSDEFPAGYSLTGCSPALPASASPAGVEHDCGTAQLRGFLETKGKQTTKTSTAAPTLIGQFFCPKDGVHLRVGLSFRLN